MSEVKTHMIIFKDSRPSEYITRAKCDGLVRVMKDRSVTYIEMKNDDGSFKELIEKREIKEIVTATQLLESPETTRWICDYGSRHPMNVWPADACGCKEKFKCYGFQMEEY